MRTPVTLAAAVLAAALAPPAIAWDAPETVVGAWRLAASQSGSACDIELLAPIAHEFEGVWYVARPLHYEDNHAACRALGVEDIVAWSGVRDETLWLLAEGDAGFMEFTAAGGGWRLVKSGHEQKPELMLTRTGDID
jgi:hypothetical protein